MNHSKEERIYYPALDGLRFIAFALVYLFHGGIPQVARGIDGFAHALGWHPMMNGKVPWSPGYAVVNNGWIGVQFFFILSGFLITTLLLEEEKRRGRIDLRAFWARRILRIWPLYYWIVLLTFFVIPWMDRAWSRPETQMLWSKQLLPFLAFGGNWSMSLIGPVPYDAISILWSVCVEEQFYLFCPLLIAWVRPSRRIGFVVFLMIVGIVGRALTAVALERQSVTPLFFQFSTITQLDTLLSGVLLALVRKTWSGQSRFSIALGPLAVLGCIALLARPELARAGIVGRTLDYVYVWIVGALLVASAASGRGLVFHVLRYERFVWLGRISYGLYMYHEIAFFLQRWLFDRIGWFPNQEGLAPFASLTLTIGLASASYYKLERPFLRLKGRWSRVESRPI